MENLFSKISNKNINKFVNNNISAFLTPCRQTMPKSQVDATKYVRYYGFFNRNIFLLCANLNKFYCFLSNLSALRYLKNLFLYTNPEHPDMETI